MFSTDRRTFGKGAALLGLGAVAGIRAEPTAIAQAAEPGASDENASQPLAPPDKQPPNLKLPEIVKKRPGWAVVGLGQLAVGEILPAFGKAKVAKLTGLVSGHPEKAKHLAKVYDVGESSIYGYDNFADISGNDDIKVIYIVLPNSMHAEYTIRALEAGKHVLCEKPMAVTAEDCERMIAAAKAADRKLGVAYRLHYEPLNRRAVELVKDGTLGKVRTISASNCQTTKAPNIRLSAKLGGGPMGDLGVYCINGACWALGEQPSHVSAIAHWPKDNPTFREVPESVSFTLEFPSGVIAACECSFGTTAGRRFRVNGTEGFIEMDPAYSYSGLSLKKKTGKDEDGSAELATLEIEQVDHFAAEMDHFSNAILNDEEPRTPGTMGLADVKIVNAVMRATETGQRTAVS